MKIGNYETGILVALKDRVFVSLTHPKRAWYWPTDGWITDPKEIENALRLDDAFRVTDMANKRSGGDDDSL